MDISTLQAVDRFLSTLEKLSIISEADRAEVKNNLLDEILNHN